MNRNLSILYLTPYNPNIKTPETGFAEMLTGIGHNVTFAFGFNPSLLKKKYDIVMGAMEYSMNATNWIGRKLDIPVYNHMEWIPPWRTGMDNPTDWGYEGQAIEDTKKEIPSWFNIYMQQIQDWENSTIRSVAGRTLIPTLGILQTRPVDTEIKYYSADFEKLEKFKLPSIKENNTIMSTARLVPHKRIIHVVRALSLLKDPPTYRIVGYGSEANKIEEEAKRLGVKVEFWGPGDNGVKERLIQESMFSVNIWAGIPAAESFYYSKPAISYDEPHMKEVFDNSILWANRNDIKSLAEKIQYFLDNPTDRKEFGEKSRELMLSDKINMGTPEKLMERVDHILNKGVDIWESKKR